MVGDRAGVVEEGIEVDLIKKHYVYMKFSIKSLKLFKLEYISRTEIYSVLLAKTFHVDWLCSYVSCCCLSVSYQVMMVTSECGYICLYLKRSFWKSE